jgi:alpha-L-fucosidase
MFYAFSLLVSFVLIIQVYEVTASTTERQPHLISAEKQSRKQISKPKIEIKYQPTWESLDSRPLPQWYDDAKIGEF